MAASFYFSYVKVSNRLCYITAVIYKGLRSCFYLAQGNAIYLKPFSDESIMSLLSHVTESSEFAASFTKALLCWCSSSRTFNVCKDDAMFSAICEQRLFETSSSFFFLPVRDCPRFSFPSPLDAASAPVPEEKERNLGQDASQLTLSFIDKMRVMPPWTTNTELRTKTCKEPTTRTYNSNTRSMYRHFTDQAIFRRVIK